MLSLHLACRDHALHCSRLYSPSHLSHSEDYGALFFAALSDWILGDGWHRTAGNRLHPLGS